MEKNNYLRSFQKKSDSELKSIIENQHQFTQQAIDASNHILTQRGIVKSNRERIENHSLMEKDETIENETSEDRKKGSNNLGNNKYITDDPNAPELYSKRAVYVLTILFSTIAGTVLMMHNLKQVNERKARIHVLVFGILYPLTIMFAFALLDIRSNLGMVFALLGAVILTEYFWNKFIGKEFLYRKKSSMKPFVVSLLIVIPLVILLVLIEN